MPTGVIYLDIDDEITSAASRIRSVEGRRVAVVLPHGSRVATSRINFRLLARDAITHEKRMSIVAGDGATRALAASAGLPVYASVQEYEAALAAEGSAAELEAAVAPVVPVEPEAPSAMASGATTRTIRSDGPARARPDAPRVPPDGPTVGPDPARPGSTGKSGRSQTDARRGSRTPFIVGALALVLVTVVGGVGAYLLLPSAAVVVTPREAIVGPLSFRVDASTDVSEPDIAGGVVPASTIPLEVQASDTFEATGERIEETPATGLVRFDNLDPTTSNTIARGAIVSTNGGIRFRTDASITIPAATLVGLTIRPSSGRVTVTAVEPGPDGNVQPNAITTVPRGEEPLFLKVTNPDETTGGLRETFARVTQEDVDAARLALTATLESALQEQLADGDLAPPDVTVFPDTATMGDPVWAVDIESLVGQEVETFELGGTAVGSVLAVDTAPIEAIALARLQANVDAGSQLVAGSEEITVEPAVVEGAAITFPVQVTAREVAVLDPDEIATRIRGLPLADAQAILDTYGTAEIEVWPDWVGTIPTLDGRLTVTVEGPSS